MFSNPDSTFLKRERGISVLVGDGFGVRVGVLVGIGVSEGVIVGVSMGIKVWVSVAVVAVAVEMIFLASTGAAGAQELKAINPNNREV